MRKVTDSTASSAAAGAPSAAGKTARFDFNKAAKKAVKDHPQLKGRSLFIDAATENFDDIAVMLAQQDFEEDEVEELENTFDEAKRRKTSFHQTVSRDEKPVLESVIFHPGTKPYFGDKVGAVDDAATFDHETGHALNPRLSGAPAENIADAYAALRNMQRFGKKTDDVDYASWKRAAMFVLTGYSTHLTTFTLDKIVIDAETANFVSLTPAQTLKIAKDYAAKNTRDEKQLTKLRKAFAGYKKMSPTKAFGKLAKMTLKAKTDSDVFYIGARVLMGATQEGGIMFDNKRIKIKDAADLREKLVTRISTLPAKHPLRKVA